MSRFHGVVPGERRFLVDVEAVMLRSTGVRTRTGSRSIVLRVSAVLSVAGVPGVATVELSTIVHTYVVDAYSRSREPLQETPNTVVDFPSWVATPLVDEDTSEIAPVLTSRAT
jgi:hypothetical protein